MPIIYLIKLCINIFVYVLQILGQEHMYYKEREKWWIIDILIEAYKEEDA